MAGSDYDIDFNWDNDPFSGDIDFDMDFDMDPFKGKGFIRSFAGGFLAGVGDETIGSSQARFRTLRTILPNTFSNALDKASFMNDRLDQLVTEFKEENAESAKSLQSIASQLNQRMGSKLPGFVSEGLSNFSSKDFSMWEKAESRDSRFNERLDSTSEEEIGQAIENSVSSQSGMFSALGESLNGMTAAATSALQASIGAGNRQLVNIESSMRDMLNYQRNVDARIQQAQLNLAARSYVNSAKFYKFMEAGVHAEIAELKKISRYTGMSDFEKTSTLTASKAFMRDRVFSTVGKRIGGLTGLIKERFGESNRKEGYGAISRLLGDISDGMEMSEGSTMSRGMVGNILGRMVAGVAVEKLPVFFSRGPGKKAIDRLTRLYPEQASYIKEQIAKLTDIGNVISYASTSGAGMLNYMAENYQAMDEMKYADYDEYVDSLPPGKKPLPKSAWTILNATGNRAKESINKLMSDTTRSRGTQYVLKRRNVKDLNQPGIWKEINNITLNEVLPGLISKTNLLLEQMRTGRDDVEQVSYNYMRGEFQSDTQKRISVQADLMPHGDFQRYAQAALTLVDSVDPDKLMSASTRKAFAQQVAKDIDAEMGFNPYYYLGEIKGMSAAAQKEIHAALMRHFGIATEDVNRYKGADSFQRMKQMSVMPTEVGRERLNSVSASASNIKQNFPNVAERIDLLRATGNEQMLRDLGVIYTENGIDKINMQAFHDRVGMYMDDPNNPLLRGVNPNANKAPPPTRRTRYGGPRNSGGSPAPVGNPYEELNATLGTLNERLSNIAPSEAPTPGSASQLASFDTMTGELTAIKLSNQGIWDSTKNLDTLMGSLIELAKSGKLITGGGTPSEERQEEAAKRSFLDKLKGHLPTGLAGRGMDFIMSRNPMVLGGILGSIGAAAAGANPLLSASIAGGGLLLGAAMDHYKRRNRTSDAGRTPEPSDDEDIIDEEGEPLLRSAKLKAGEYLDAATRRVIKTWQDIRGPIYDVISKTVIGARDLAGKIFGADGRAIALRGLRLVRDQAVAGFNALDPIGRIKSVISSGRELVYQQDVYVKGEKDPVLRAGKFKTGEYYTRDESGNFKPINGWNEINGPVYDEQGNQLVSEAEYQSGLVTASGMAVRNLGGGIANVVGGAAGLAKSGLNSLLGRFGYGRQDSPGTANAGGRSGGGSSGVEQRLDKIYRMLSQHFGLPMEEGGNMDEGERSRTTGGSSGPGLRLNSLAWKRKHAEDEERHKVNEAIIKIAKNTEDLAPNEGEDNSKKGFWGTIKDMMVGLGAFGVKLIKNPIGTIGGLVFGSLLKSTERLANIGKSLFSGVLGVASPIYSLMKWGFGKIAGAFTGKAGDAAGDLFGGNGDGEGEPDQRGQGGRRRTRNTRAGDRRRRRVRNRQRLRRAGSWAKGAGLSYLGSLATDYISGNDDEDFQDGTEDLESGERDPATGRYKTTSDTVLNAVTGWLPQGMLAESAVKGILGPDGYADLDDKGLFWTTDGSIFFSRQKRDAAQAVLEGKPVIAPPPGANKSNTQLTIQKKIRLAMYGIKDPESNLARRVMSLENEMYQYVVIRNDRASLKPDAPIDKIVDTFANSGISKWNDKSAIGTWFMARFKPIFLVYNAAASVARLGDIVEFDNSKSYDAVQVVERVQRSVAELNPPPYTVDVRIDDKEATMGPEETRDVIIKLFAEMKKAIPAPPSSIDKIATTAEANAKVEAMGGKSTATSLAGMLAQNVMGSAAAKASMRAAESQNQQPAEVTSINVSDLLPGQNTEMDALTMTRLAAYGNTDNIPWRVEAVLRLERYMENFIIVTGNDAKFTGKSSQILEMFKASFRLTNDFSKNSWSLWFRDRFLPVLMEYCKQVYQLRGGMPGKTWKSLSDTNRAVVARKLVEIVVASNDQQVPVWSIEASPFPDSKSGTYADRADKYLKFLDAKAQEARLKDPELEQTRSSSTNTKEEITQRAQAANIQQRTQAMLNSVYKTGSTGFSAGGGPIGSSGSAAAQGGYYPNATMSAPGGGAGSAGAFMGQANSSFNPEFIKQAGEDKGIKMSLEQGEQLMLNHLVKAGFRDNKTIALALAMARKETGNYQNTVENTNWSAPTLLKYFKNIPDAATAQKVAAMSPAERAMYVYGRAPKGPQLGNSRPEDGWNYRGRGLFQLTGKANYEAFKKATGIDVVSNPRLVSEDPNVMAESAVWYLKNNAAMKSIAAGGDFDTAVRGINGGNAVPATDERRSFYNDYLNRLRSGDLTIAGGTDDENAQAGDASAMANQSPEVPAAADKNVPADKIVKDGGPAVVKPGSVKELLDQADKGSAPSNAGSALPTSNASPITQTTVNGSTPAATNTNAPATSSGPSGDSSSAVPASVAAPAETRQPVKSAVQARNEKLAAEKAALPPTVNLPEQMSTQDQALAILNGKQLDVLTQILDTLKSKGNGQPVVKV